MKILLILSMLFMSGFAIADDYEYFDRYDEVLLSDLNILQKAEINEITLEAIIALEIEIMDFSNDDDCNGPWKMKEEIDQIIPFVTGTNWLNSTKSDFDAVTVVVSSEMYCSNPTQDTYMDGLAMECELTLIREYDGDWNFHEFEGCEINH